MAGVCGIHSGIGVYCDFGRLQLGFVGAQGGTWSVFGFVRLSRTQSATQIVRATEERSSCSCQCQERTRTEKFLRFCLLESRHHTFTNISVNIPVHQCVSSIEQVDLTPQPPRRERPIMAPASDSGKDGPRSLDPGQKRAVADTSRDKVLWTSVFVDSVAPFLDFSNLGKFAQTCTTASQIVYDRSSGTTRSILSSLELTLKKHPGISSFGEDGGPQQFICAPLLTPKQLNYLDLKRVRVFRVLVSEAFGVGDYFGCVDVGALSHLQSLIDGLGPNVELFSLTVEQSGGWLLDDTSLDDTSREAISQTVIRFLLRARDLRTLELPGFIFACKVEDPAPFDGISFPAIQKLSFLFPISFAGDELGDRITAAISQNQQLLVHALLPKANSLAAFYSAGGDGFKWLEALLPVLSSVKHFSLQMENLQLETADIVSLRKYVGCADYPLRTFRTVGVHFSQAFSKNSWVEWTDWLEDMMHPESSLKCIEFLKSSSEGQAKEIFSASQYHFLEGLAVGLRKGADLGGLAKFVEDMFPKTEQ